MDKTFWKNLKENSFRVDKWPRWKKDYHSIRDQNYKDPNHPDHLHWKIYWRDYLVKYLTDLDPELFMGSESGQVSYLIELFSNHTKTLKVVHKWKDL